MRHGLVRRTPVHTVVHRNTTTKPMGKTPFFLIYEAEAVLPHVVKHCSARVLAYDETQQDAMRGMDLVLAEERRCEAALRAARYQQAPRRYHCRNFRSRTLETGDLVLRRVLSREGLHNLSAMWEGPFRIARVNRPGAACLETQDEIPIQNAGTSSTSGSSTHEARPSAYEGLRS